MRKLSFAALAVLVLFICLAPTAHAQSKPARERSGKILYVHVATATDACGGEVTGIYLTTSTGVHEVRFSGYFGRKAKGLSERLKGYVLAVRAAGQLNMPIIKQAIGKLADEIRRAENAKAILFDDSDY